MIQQADVLFVRGTGRLDTMDMNGQFCLSTGLKRLPPSHQINTTGATSGTEIDYPYGVPKLYPGFQWGQCYQIFSLICMFCRSLFVLLSYSIMLSVLLRFTDSDYPFVTSNSSCSLVADTNCLLCARHVAFSSYQPLTVRQL